MSAHLTSSLCTQCGLCCDGSLFEDVELADQAEAYRLEALGVDVDDEAPPVLFQPCSALQGRRCGIYSERPGYCRQFECRLLQDAQEGLVAEDRALSVIADTLRQVESLKQLCRDAGNSDETLPLKMRCIEVLSLPCDGDDDRGHELRGTIALAMDTMGEILQEHFLN